MQRTNHSSRIMVFSSLYPNPFQPIHGMFVAELCRALSKIIPITVVAPVNGFHWLRNRVGLRAGYQRYSTSSISIFHPLFFTIPRFFKTMDARLMALGCRRAFRHAFKQQVNLVHAHYAYPESVAAAHLCCRFGLPLVMTAHGSDINVIAKDAGRRRQIVKLLRKADAIVTVSKELGRKVKNLAGHDINTVQIANGVSLDNFFGGDRQAARINLGLSLDKTYLLAVGRLEPVKAYDKLIKALVKLPLDINLILVGAGNLRDALRALSRQAGLADRVFFAGPVTHEQLGSYYRAANFLVISSHSEGWPTVIYESLACGTPVLAHAVGGIPEILTDNKIGMLIPDNEPETLAAYINQASGFSWDRDRAEETAKLHTWERVAEQHVMLYEDVIHRRKVEQRHWKWR